MSDKYYSEPDESAALRSWVLWQMMRGAGIAAIGVFSIGLVLWAIWGASQLLDPRSKEAPSPYGVLQMAELTAVG